MNPPQGPDDWQAKMPGEIVGLIESTPHPPPRVEWYRDDHIGVREDSGTGRPHHGRKRDGEAAAAFVLERVNDLAQRTLVAAGGSGGVNKARHAAAPGTALEGGADYSP